MAALGRKRSFIVILSECPLPGVKRTLDHPENHEKEGPLTARSGHCRLAFFDLRRIPDRPGLHAVLKGHRDINRHIELERDHQADLNAVKCAIKDKLVVLEVDVDETVTAA